MRSHLLSVLSKQCLNKTCVCIKQHTQATVKDIVRGDIVWRKNVAEANAVKQRALKKNHLEFGELLSQGHYCTESVHV